MHKEFGLPVGVTNVRVIKDGVEYPVDTSHIHTRTGSPGSIPVLTLFQRDKYEGEILEAAWRKGWDANIGGGNQPFVAKLDTTNGLLLMYGEAAVAGTAGSGWINNKNPAILMDAAELVVELESPIADTGMVASRDIRFEFYLIPSFVETVPSGQTNYLRVKLDVTDAGLLAAITKYVNSVSTTLWDGSTKDGNSARDPAADQFWKFKLVFNGKPGTTGATVSVYAKTGNSRVNMEADTWEELYDSVGTQDSPFDLSDLAFHVAYPCYQIYTQNTSYFDDVGDEAKSTELTVTYPDFQLKWSDTDTDYTGGVELYDGDPGSGGQRVLSQDHEFLNNDPYLQNGLIRCQVDSMVEDGLKLYVYISGAWSSRLNNELRFYLDSSAFFLSYPEFKEVYSDPRNPEKIIIKVRLHDTSTVNQDYYVDALLTMRRGSYALEIEVLDVYPTQNYRFRSSQASGKIRFVYAGNDAITDLDVAQTNANGTMDDNFNTALDNAGDAVLLSVSIDEKPNTNYQPTTFALLYLISFLAADRPTINMIVTPFSLIANTFKEAESATISAAARLYLDGAGEDTTTENSGKWAATLNCAVDENDAAMPPQVGAKDVKITSSGAGAVTATDTPAVPLGKLTKFDYLKLWLSRSGAAPASVTARLVDADGDSVTKAQAITASPIQYSLSLPHSSTDLQGWTEVGTYNFATFHHLTIEWTALGAGEIVYVDGLHEYIGTTTTRGRGETLSGASAVVLDAQHECVFNNLTNVLTKLPIGKYLLVIRAKDTDQVASDSIIFIYDSTETKYKSETNNLIYKTLTSSFAYYVEPFDLKLIDSGETVQLRSQKALATENTIFVDSFLIVPLGDGRDLPQDLAHSSLTTADVRRRVYRR